MKHVDYLNATVWATLRPSKIHGVGVFAIRDIPKGTKITDWSVHDIRNRKIAELCVLYEEELAELHPAIQALILDRTTFSSRRVMQFYSPNIEVCLRSFMNHAGKPNSDGKLALRAIKEGEEITEDFRTLVEGDMHPLTKAHFSFL